MGQEDRLEKGMATHSGILAWRIPWTEEPGGLQSTGSQRVRHNCTAEHTRTNAVSVRTVLCQSRHLSPKPAQEYAEVTTSEETESLKIPISQENVKPSHKGNSTPRMHQWWNLECRKKFFKHSESSRQLTHVISPSP